VIRFNINKKNNNIVIIDIMGKFDMDCINTFNTMTGGILNEDINFILINFKKLEYIDSSGIGELIRLMNMAKISSVELILFNISDIIMKMFKSAYLENFLIIKTEKELMEIFPDLVLK